jgi:triacylglycerol lipase
MVKVRGLREFAIIAACVWLSACVSISQSELRTRGSALTVTEVDFEDLHRHAVRAHTAYASEPAIRSQYPATVRVSVPEGTDVLYFLERDDGTKAQYIAVRGTIDKKNLSEDLDIHVREDVETGIPLHQGFDATADALYADMQPHLKRGYKTYFTGHSLGGAIAALLTVRAVQDGYDVVRVVTFGQPRFTTAAGIDRLAMIPIIRVVDENDMVPMLPPATKSHAKYGPYEHVGQEIILLEGPHYVYLSSHDANRIAIGEFWRSMAFSNLDDHKMTKYLDRLAAKKKGGVQVPYDQRERYVARPPQGA